MEGATISRDDEGRNSLLYLCCRCIFSYGVSVSSGVNNNGASLLHLACAANSGGKFFIDILLSTCKDDPPTVSNCFNCEDRSLKSPLYYACVNMHYEIVELACSGNYNLCPDNVYLCMELPTISSDEKITAVLLKAITFENFVARTDKIILSRHLQGMNTFFFKDCVVHPLYMASAIGDLSFVRYLSNKMECDINNVDKRHLPAVDTKDRTPLHVAAKFGHEDIVRFFIEEQNYSINVVDCAGQTSLHLACQFDRINVVKYLVSRLKCRHDAVDSNGYQPLHYAICQDSKNIVNFLIDEASSDDLYDCIRSAGLARAPFTMINLLLKRFGLKEYLTQAFEEDKPSHIKVASIIDSLHPLHAAVKLGCPETVHYLVNGGIMNINADNGLKAITPLHLACEKGNFEIVQSFTNEPRCQLEVEDINCDRPLHKACHSGHTEIVCHLVIKGCDVTAEGQDGYTPLHYACEIGSSEMVFLLTRHPQCDVEAKNDWANSETPLHKACVSGNVEIVFHLVTMKHCNVNAVRFNGDTPLHISCEKASLELVKILTDNKCDKEVENVLHDRPLHKACWSENIAIVWHLVSINCKVSAKGNKGHTPLHIACEKGNFEIVKILTSHPDCNVEALNKDQNRPLHIACKSGSTKIVNHLVVDKGCDVGAKGNEDCTPLHYACEKGSLEIVILLTNQSQCDVESENYSNERPLHKACESGNIDIVSHLVVKLRCSVDCANKAGLTPLDIASRKKNQKMFTILSSQIQQSQLEIIAMKNKGMSSFLKYEKAQQTSGLAQLCVVKCILTGPPGSGKSTLKKRFLNESLTEPSYSTGIVDAAIPVDSFRKLTQHNAIATTYTEWNVQDPDEEAVLVLENILTNHKDSEDTSDTTDVYEEPTLDTSLETPPPSPFVPEHTQRLKESKAETGEIEDEQVCRDALSNKGITALTKHIDTIPITKRKECEKKCEQINQDCHTILHIIDTGGQPELHELLPALITGPAINLLVFKLSVDLRSRYSIQYRSPIGESEPYETSLSHEEVIFRSLASIACLRQNTIGWPWKFNEVPIKDDSKSAAFLIATHRDLVDSGKVSEVNEQLKMKIKNSPQLFEEGLVQFSSPEQVIFAIDTTKDEEEIEELRSTLHDIISANFSKLLIPASWCTFSLKLRKSKKKLYKYDACYKLAQECGIKDQEDFQSALWFLHQRVGIIMHYPQVEELEDIIITDLQLVYDRIEKLLTNCFTFKVTRSAAVENQFRKCGQFSDVELDRISSRQQSDPLTPKRLLALLKHLYIVVFLRQEKVGRKNVSYYFMPCALKPALLEHHQPIHPSPHLSPLLMSFDCGYTPVGVFCCLVVYLLNNAAQLKVKWTLKRMTHNRNKITFDVGEYYDTVTLFSHATYLEVHVENKSQLTDIHISCEQILTSLHQGLETVTKSLHYTQKSAHNFGVPCSSCPSLHPHPSIINISGAKAAKCEYDAIMKLDESHLPWYTRVHALHKQSDQVCSHTQLLSERSDISDSSAGTTSAVEIFRSCFYDVANAISSNVTRIITILYSQKLIPGTLLDDILSATGTSDFDKATKVTRQIQRDISSNSYPHQYLAKLCRVLMKEDNDTLQEISTTMLNQLGEPVRSSSSVAVSSTLSQSSSIQTDIEGTRANKRQSEQSRSKLSLSRKRSKISDDKEITEHSDETGGPSPKNYTFKRPRCGKERTISFQSDTDK